MNEWMNLIWNKYVEKHALMCKILTFKVNNFEC